MSSGLPPLRVLDALGREIDGAIARAQGRPAPRFVHTFVLALLGVLMATGAAAAASYVLTGSPIPGSRSGDVPPEATPREGSARLAGLGVSDPGGGPAWDMRVSQSETGQRCTAVGQVVDGDFGLVGLDDRFRRLPLVGVDACGARTAVWIGARVFDADTREQVRTVVNGVGGAGLRSVEVSVAGDTRTLAPRDGGTFLAVYRGYVEELRPRVVLRYADGSERTHAFATSTAAQAVDPEGGPPWTVTASRRGGGPRGGQTCAQARRTRGRNQTFMPITPPICGDLARDPLFFDVVAFPRAGAQAGRFAWLRHAPRTLVWGAASKQVRSIAVQLGRERHAVDLAGEGTGFVAALPAGTDPAAVRVHVAFADGSARSYSGGRNLRGERGARQRSVSRPAASPPASPSSRPARLVVIPGTTAIEVRARARDGRGDWALRGWRARGWRGGGAVRCVQLGRIVRGVFRVPGGSASPPSEVGSVCARERELRDAIASRSETLLDDGFAYAPRRVAGVAWGLAPAGSRTVTIDGLGARRSVRPSRRGAFLVVAPPRETAQGTIIRARVAGGATVSSRREGFRPAPVLPGSARIEARAPDPDGAQPRGLLVWRLRSGDRCHAEGEIVGGQVGFVDQERGVFHRSPIYEGGACEPVAPSRPVSLSVSSAVGDPAAGALSRRARTERRTLPGRTVVSGFARRDVRAITIQTPRDVRTLRPSRRSGAFLVVYDGEFFGGGEIKVTASLAGGRTATQTLPLAS